MNSNAGNCTDGNLSTMQWHRTRRPRTIIIDDHDMLRRLFGDRGSPAAPRTAGAKAFFLSLAYAIPFFARGLIAGEDAAGPVKR